MGEYLTIKEAAAALDVSADTIRRRIKSGEIKAQKLPGPYGKQWQIKEDHLTLSAEIIDVVPVRHDMNARELALLIREAVDQGQRQQAEEMERLRAEISRLNEQLEGLTKMLPAAAADNKKRWWQLWK